MNIATPNLTPKDELLQAVGRNVVNFQRLERCLKMLARFSSLSGTASTVGEYQVRNASKTDSLTLGGAIREWELVAGSGERVSPPTPDLFEPSFSISYGAFIKPDALEKHGQRLRELAKERNNLVHHVLADFDFSSEEACRAYSQRLDGQNARILHELSFLAPVVREICALRESLQDPATIDQLVEGILAAQRAHDA